MPKKIVREIPKKNYITAGLYIIVSIILIFYIARWYGVYQEDNLNKAIIGDYLSTINYEEFPSYLIENANVIVYIGITGDINCRTFENKFKNIVESYDLKDNIVYLNINTFSENNIDYITQINNKYADKKVLNKVPALAVFENGKFKAILDSNLTKANTVKFLEKYEVIN